MRTISFRHRLPALPTALALAAGVIGCGSEKGPTEPAIPAVASVQVTPAFDTLTALGQTHQLAAVAKDASGTPISGKTFTWASSAPNVVSVDAATGLARAVANGDAKITATVGDKSGQAALTVEQQVATVSVTPPTASLTAIGATQQFTAVAKDANNNTVAGAVFLWLSSNHNVATMDGAGLATAIGPGSVTITAAARGLPGNATLSVMQAPAKLAFTVQPSSATAGEALSPAVQVEVQDAAGVRVANARDPVTLAVATNPGVGTLHGTNTVNAVDGIATFSGLWIDKVGTGYVLGAASASLGGATSAAFDIAPAAAARLAFTTQPPAEVSVGTVIPTVRVTLYDGFGNLVPAGTVTIAVGTNPGGATLSGTLSVGAANGVASFADLRVNKTGLGYTLAASLGPVTGVSASFNVDFVLVSADAGSAHTCGVTTGGVAYCWGDNLDGQLGDGTATNRTTPVAVAGGLAFVAVRAGGGHTCGVTIGGAGYCWGSNFRGQLGDGTTTDRTTPVAVAGGLTFAALSPGSAHTCGVTTDGALYCWGYNGLGQLGDGTTTDSPTPVRVAIKGPAFAAVSTGVGHTCAVTTGGVAYCWGLNASGQLGDGSTTNRTTPIAVAGGLTFAAASTGDFHTCGIATGRVAYCWGSNFFGQLGDGTTTNRSTPVAVSGGLAFVAVRAGGGHTCGVTTGFDAGYCWGSNFFGQLGDGTTTSRLTPVAVSGGLAFAAVSAGYQHTCGVTTGGVAYCWGWNVDGQLGDGTTTDRPRPVIVTP